MKKVVSVVVALSIALSSLPQVAFAAKEPAITFNQECFMECLNPKDNTLKLDCYDTCLKSRPDAIRISSNASLKNDIKYKAKVALVENLMQPVAWISYFAMSQIVRKVGQWLVKRAVGKIEAPTNPLDIIKNLDEGLSLIKGQENAKKQMRSVVLSIVDQRSYNSALEKGKKGARIIYMVGPSGSGKSYSAELLTKVLTGSESKPFIIEASDIDKQSKNTSPVDQLFGMRLKRENKKEFYEQAPLVKQIASTPELVVIINEYDKMHTPELDEKLRTIADQGYISVDGEKVDCSKATFIITSNESASSVSNTSDEADDIDDGTGTRTIVKHDKAFLGRLNVINFEPLTAKEYEEIAAPIFEEVLKRYSEEYGIELNLGDTLKTVAKKVALQNKGARPIFTFVDSLKQTILNNVVLNSVNDEERKNKLYNIRYDETLDEFILEEASSKEIADLESKDTALESQDADLESDDTVLESQDAKK